MASGSMMGFVDCDCMCRARARIRGRIWTWLAGRGHERYEAAIALRGRARAGDLPALITPYWSFRRPRGRVWVRVGGADVSRRCDLIWTRLGWIRMRGSRVGPDRRIVRYWRRFNPASLVVTDDENPDGRNAS
jgi:hypothetical protein